MRDVEDSVRVNGEIKFCDCGRMKPVRGDMDICEPCYAIVEYKRQRRLDDEKRIGNSSESVSS